jgi:histone acetyltransferase (RNA polymerase elongator complex component)
MIERPFIVPIFIPQAGCPHRCIFCNGSKISGEKTATWTGERFRAAVEMHLERPHRKRPARQIAFYGGNFTGLDEAEQLRLLRFAKHYIDGGFIDSLRVSTRPDYINQSALETLKAHGVATVEIGAQSMDDRVLEMSQRSHTAEDVAVAVSMLKSAGFETGVHLMAGLPGDSAAGFRRAVEAVIGLRPDTVRIHPTLVFEDTGLAELCRFGRYTPLSMEDAVDLCKHALIRFTKAGIPVIRLGLQTTTEMEAAGSVLAGPCHPAFRSLVEGELFRDMAFHLSSRMAEGGGTEPLTFSMAPKDVSSFLGLRGVNLEKLRVHWGREIAYGTDSLMTRGALALTCGGKTSERRIGDLLR